MARLESASNQDNLVVASGTITSTALGRHFAYELSDNRAKSNLLKGAGRDVLEIADKKTCIMLTFSVGAFKEVVIPTVDGWGNGSPEIQINDLKIVIEELTPGFDGGQKNVDTLVRFLMNGDRITVCCYNTTQRIKVEGKGYHMFVSKFLQPLLCDKISRVPPGRIDKYNKDVIAALSGKRKAISRPGRSVKYKAMAKLPCSKCEISFANNSQLNNHKKTMHTRGGNDSNASIRNIPIIPK